MKLSFTKMQGCANDYIYLDCRKSGVPENIAALSEKLSRRHFSIGADGIICICAAQTAGADGMMRIFNADGSEGKMCGNAIRCVGKCLYEKRGVKNETVQIETQSGVKTLKLIVENGSVKAARVDMGKPILNPGHIPVKLPGDRAVGVRVTLDREREITAVSMGNPHCVIFTGGVETMDVETPGRLIENHELFPDRVNVEFAEVLSRTRARMRVWERGSGETWACGTGTCATVAALVEQGLCPAGEDVHVALRGGELTIRVLPGRQLLMTGAASTVYEAVIEV